MRYAARESHTYTLLVVVHNFSSTSNSRTVRNPLSLDELVSFSKQLLDIAFTMYWRDDQSIMHELVEA